MLLFIMPIGSDIRLNKRNATAVSHMSEEALKACLLPSETCYFICKCCETKKVKKETANVSIAEGLPSGEVTESKEVTTKKGE